MPENARQDVKTRSHRIHFTFNGSKYDFFYLVGLEYYLLKYSGYERAPHAEKACILGNLHLFLQMSRKNVLNSKSFPPGLQKDAKTRPLFDRGIENRCFRCIFPKRSIHFSRESTRICTDTRKFKNWPASGKDD